VKFQHDAKLRCTLIGGMGGSGKSTLELKAIVADRDLACRFLFDPKGDLVDRLGLAPAETAPELDLAIEDTFCIFQSSTMFPGDRAAGLDWFCRFVLERSFVMPGRKLLVIPEVWKHCNRNTIPQSLAECVQDGRKHGVETMFDTQHPERVNGSILGEVTELISFRLHEEKSLDFAESRGFRREELSALPLGSFVGRNCLTGAEWRARLW